MKLVWTIAAFGSLAWYVLLTGYVAVRAAKDIRAMLARLGARKETRP
jgi:hypothetical protein